MIKVREDILFFAFRYALGRRSAAVSILVDELKSHWQEFGEHTQDQIKEEIGDAIQKDQAGDKCDIDHWREILSL